MPWGGFRAPSRAQRLPGKWYTTHDVCVALRVHRLTLWRWIKTNRIHPVKMGGRYRISQAELDRFMGTRRALPID